MTQDTRYLIVHITIDTMRHAPIIAGHTQKHTGIKQHVLIPTNCGTIYSRGAYTCPNAAKCSVWRSVR